MNTNFNEPLQPKWPINVKIFNPKMSIDHIKNEIEPTQDPFDSAKKYKDDDGNEKTVATYTSDHHFDTKHYALLFAPGEYKNCDFEVGYYVSMAGLGKYAKDAKGDEKGKNAVIFTSDPGKKSGPFVPSLNKHRNGGLCLDTFWRSAENYTAENTQWAVSQASPLRRVCISDTLTFGEGGAYSSGGFLANAEVGNNCDFAANQQWFSRAVDFQGSASNGSWSIVFSGCTGGLPQRDIEHPGGKVVTIEEKPKVRMEKPFIVMNDEGDFELHVPKTTTEQTIGADLFSDNNEVRSFAQVKVCKPILPFDADGNYINHPHETYNVIKDEDKKLTLELQQALDEGKDLLLCPGIFFLTQPLVIKHPNQVILGIGLATLVAPQDGSPCIRVQAKTPGVRIAGLVLEASKQIESSGLGNNSDGVKSLLEFGEPHVTDDTGDAKNPGLISDVFTRVGGSNLDRTVYTDVMVRIHSGNVVGDNLWLWRADHVNLAPGEEPNDPKLDYHQTRIWEEKDGKKVKVNECIAKNAIEVRGDDVKMYGLFCEHTTEHQMIWKGERGSVTFFQCELPYDVDVDYGYTGYYVDESVDVHTAMGIGVYCNFTCYDVNAKTGIIMPAKEGVTLTNPFTHFLDSKGSIQYVVQCGEVLKGDAAVGPAETAKSQRAGWLGKFSTASPPPSPPTSASTA